MRFFGFLKNIFVKEKVVKHLPDCTCPTCVICGYMSKVYEENKDKFDALNKVNPDYVNAFKVKAAENISIHLPDYPDLNKSVMRDE